MRYAQIMSTGSYVPERMMTNAEFQPLLGESVDEWLVKNVGIKERHFMSPEQVTSDLAVNAARVALARAQLEPTDLDLVIVTSDTPDYISPGTASVVQAKLGAVNAGTFDVNCACAAWVTGLDIAAKQIAVDPGYSHVLVVAAYGMSKYIDWKDKATATLFADGAGAVVLRAGDEPGFMASKLIAAGEYHDALGIYVGGNLHPATAENLERYGPSYVKFVRKFPKAFNSDHWPVLIRDVLKKADPALTLDDIDQYYFTQLNLRTIETTMAALAQPMYKTHWVMDKWGYTGSACIPMALDDAIAQGKGPRPGDRVMFCASGGGIAMAAALFQWTE
ncbi:MAG: ketoacyl-ACP synthase III [Anaerolineae bacterium]